MQSKLSTILTCVLSICLLVLTACGGGGSSSKSTATTTTTTTTPTTITLTGVAAIGAPLVDASITVVDATGTAVPLLNSSGNTITNGVTNVADGSYQLILGTGSPKMPLFIEAVGADATGLPVVLHSLVEANTTPMVANITPLTDAVVAEVLGGNPMPIFQNASANVSLIAQLGNASIVTAASTQIKTIIGTNLTSAGVSTPSALNLFQDTTFVTNKKLLDAALEGLRIQITKDASGNDQLQLSNRFVAIAQPEVAVSLSTAKTQLNLGTVGNLASAIVSTLKTTTCATSTLTNIGVLDTLTVAINSMIAQRANAANFAPLLSATPAPPSPALGNVTATATTYAYNGRVTSDLEALLAGYAANNYQLSAMQITGCIDNPIPTAGCTHMSIAAVVTNNAGAVVDMFSDGVIYSKTTTPNWMLSGNGRYANVAIYPVAYASFGLNGSLTSSTSANPNPSIGVQANILAQNLSTGAETVGDSEVQIPSDQSVPYAYCNLSMLCAWPNPSVLPVATGDLPDTLLQQPVSGWIGNVDAIIGAAYVVTYGSWITANNQTATVYLPAGVPTNLSTGLFPAIDGVSSSAPLTDATIEAGFTLSWVKWAAANPNMRLFSVRTVVAGTTISATTNLPVQTTPLITDYVIPFGNVTSIVVAPTTLPAGFTSTEHEVWIGAVDNLDHRYYTQLMGP